MMICWFCFVKEVILLGVDWCDRFNCVNCYLVIDVFLDVGDDII